MSSSIKKTPISLKDKFVLSPIEKHIYYKRFPYKLIIHLLLVVFTTIQVLVVVDSEYTAHAREQIRVFRYMFLVMDLESDSDSAEFLTIADFQNHLTSLSHVFKTMNDQLYQNYFDTHSDFSLGIYYMMPSADDPTNTNAMFPVDFDSDLIGPIDPSNVTNLKYWTSVASLAQLQANNLVTVIHSSPQTSACMSWNISLSYNFETFSQIQASLKATNRYCSVTHEGNSEILGEFRRGNYFVNVIVLILSSISLVLSMRHVYAAANVYMKARFYYQGRNRNQDYNRLLRYQSQILSESSGDQGQHLKRFLDMNVPWEKLPLSEKIKFFDFWFIVGTIGNAVQVIASLAVILTFQRNVGQEILTRDNVIVGFGCFFAWFQIMYYIQFARDIILLTSTFSKSLAENLVFFGLVSPLFLGFTFLLQSLFWSYYRFDSTSITIESLIAMACGYVVYDIFDDTQNFGLFKQLFIYMYFLIFYTSVNEIFVSIIMEGYDRCTVRKEIDNDDPFPMTESLQESIRKSMIEEKSEENSSFIYMAPSPLSDFDSSPLILGRDNSNQSVLSFDQDADPMTVCLNKLNRRKTEIYDKVSMLSEIYASIDKDTLTHDDLLYVQNIYTECLTRIMVRIQRYQSKKI